MKLMKTLASGAAAVALTTAFATVATPVLAQQTTSDIRGTVTDNDGASLPGVTVTVTDTRTGASRTTVTDGNGSFAARNLTVGGPYTVSTSLDGFQAERLEGVQVSLSGSTVLAIDLDVGAASSDEIIVVATRTNVSELAIGPSSSFGLEELKALPSISRDIRDVIRIDPRVVIDGTNDDNISCMGGNNRFNSFTIDGVRSNDAFGLNASGFPSRNNLPIPFDSIRETSVEFSPFDVEYGQFTGCNINVVTQSGSNDFHGSGFAVYNSSGLTGKKLEGDDVSGDTFKDYNWGMTLGGPVIKDKLFFFVAYEQVLDGGDIANVGPEDGGFANPVGGLTTATVNQISDILGSTYGLDTGGILRVFPEDSKKILTRWDWLITDDHRLEFTYSRLREGNVETDDLGFDSDFIFANTHELEGTRAETYSARLFSQWTDNFSTEIRASRNDNQDLQGPVGGGEAQDANPIPIFRIDSLGDGSAIVQNGPGQFRSANDLQTQIDQVKVKADYVKGNHTLSLGYELDQLDVFNLFVVQATGIFEFDSIADLQSGLASSITGNGSFSGDINDAAASFSRSIHTVYAQDEWQVNDALNLTLGIRYDFFNSSDAPRASNLFMQRYGFSNSTGFDDLDGVILPRFAFAYDAGDTMFGNTQFRGGAGIFSGGDPTVWFSNAFSNFGSGIGFGRSSGAGCTGADLQVLNGGSFTGIPQCILDQQQTEAGLGGGRTDAIDPNFDVPTIIRGSFGFTHHTDFAGAMGGFFDDWRVDIDVIHSRRRNAPDFVDLTLTPTGVLAPDGRPLFNAVDPLLPGCTATFIGPRDGFTGGDLSQGGACDAGRDDQDILLTNVRGDNGGSTTFSAIFNKGFDYVTPVLNKPGNFDFTVGYAFTNAKDVNPSTSSTATSNFEEVAVAIINQPVLAPSQFFNDHNITIAARFGQEFVRDYETSFNFFFAARSGRRFSFAFDNNTATTLFGDSDNEERNLFYVPTGPNDPLVDFSGMSAADQTALFDFLGTSGLDKFAGQISPRNQFRNPWFLDLDFRFQQELPAIRKQDRAIFFIDIENLPNIIDNGKNVFREHDNGDVAEALPVLDAALSADGSQFVFTNFNPGGSRFDPDVGIFADRDVDDSVWAVQIGFRYEF